MIDDRCHQCHQLISKTKLFWRRSPTREPILLCPTCLSGFNDEAGVGVARPSRRRPGRRRRARERRARGDVT